MLANFFEKTKPINSIVLGLLFITYFSTHSYTLQSSSLDHIHWGITLSSFFLNSIFLLFSTLFFIKNGVSNDNLHNTFIIILLYGMFPQAFMSIKLIVVSILFLLIYKNLAQLNSKGKSQLSVFDTGVFTGISFLLYNWSIFFLVFIFATMLITQKASFKNIIGVVFGFLSPLIIFFTYAYIIDNTAIFTQKFDLIPNLNYEFYSQLSVKIPILLISIFTIISCLLVLPRVMSVSGPYRYQYILALLMLLIAIVSLSLKESKDGSEFLLTFVPIGIIIGRFLKSITHRVTKELLFIGFTICSLYFFVKNS